MLKNRSIPFGYCMVNGKYALNALEAETVRKIFAEYIGGKSLKTIAAEMQIPYNMGKAVWNKNMVCRVLENRKYIGENGYPQIITAEDFEQTARIKAERNTYRKPTPQDEPQQGEIQITEYQPTEEIQRMTNEINRQLDSENPDKEKVEALIITCAQLKYTAIREVKHDNHGNTKRYADRGYTRKIPRGNRTDGKELKSCGVLPRQHRPR